MVQGVAHVQLAGDVRRRQHDGIGLRLRGCIRGEVTGAYPAFVEVFFYCLRLPGLGKLVRAVGANELLFILISHLANSTLCVNWHHRPV